MLQKVDNIHFSASQLRRELRQARADNVLTNMTEKDEDLKNAILQNKFGCMCMIGGKFEISEKHLTKSLEEFEKLIEKIPTTNVLMNFGNLYAQLKQKDKAITFYQRVIQESPYQEENQHDQRGIVWSKRLNSYGAYVDAHTNLACLLANEDKLEESYVYCMKAIKMNPLNFEAQTNLGDLLRQLGRNEEALSHTWQQIVEFTQVLDPDYCQPEPIDCQSLTVTMPKSSMINIFCVKWGKKYGADYVNKLYRGVKNNTVIDFQFYCLTDDGEGLLSEIKQLDLEEGWTGWWGKVTLFSLQNIEGRMIYLDLDMIITGNIDELLKYDGPFAILRTDEIACEKSNKNGYNSSVMAWSNNSQFSAAYTELKKNKDNIHKFIVRFDFWLEMIIKKADFLQVLFPSQISDYVLECTNELPENTRIVSFPRTPKPHDATAEWISKYWV